MTENRRGIGFIPEDSDFEGRMPVGPAPELVARERRRLRWLRRGVLVGLVVTVVIFALTMSMQAAVSLFVGGVMGYLLAYGDVIAKQVRR